MFEPQSFTSKGVLEDLEDATNFVLMMTDGKCLTSLNSTISLGLFYNSLDSQILSELDDTDDEAESDSGFLLGQERPLQEDGLFPTPIDTDRMNVVPLVILSRDLLCHSEREHLRSLVNLLKMPLPLVSTDDDEDDASVSGPSTLSTTSVSWKQRFQELLEFREQYGHVNVPYDFPPNPPLAQWVKRQRHQYRLLKEGRHSNLTPNRLEQLECIDYCWDSRQAHWLDRFYELQEFQRKNAHIRVSKRNLTDRPLAVWLKRQRHQGRLFLQGKTDGSNMTHGRLQKLVNLGVKFAAL